MSPRRAGAAPRRSPSGLTGRPVGGRRRPGAAARHPPPPPPRRRPRARRVARSARVLLVQLGADGRQLVPGVRGRPDGPLEIDLLGHGSFFRGMAAAADGADAGECGPDEQRVVCASGAGAVILQLAGTAVPVLQSTDPATRRWVKPHRPALAAAKSTLTLCRSRRRWTAV